MLSLLEPFFLRGLFKALWLDFLLVTLRRIVHRCSDCAAQHSQGDKRSDVADRIQSKAKGFTEDADGETGYGGTEDAGGVSDRGVDADGIGQLIFRD